MVAERIHEYLSSVEERAHAAQIEAAVQRRGRKLTVALSATVLSACLAGGGGWLWIQNRDIARELVERRQHARQTGDETGGGALSAGRVKGGTAGLGPLRRKSPQELR